MPAKLTFESVSNFFEENGCDLLEVEYINNTTPMRYLCSCGIHSVISFNKFKGAKMCKRCAFEKRAENQRIPYEEVKLYFEKENCKLLTDKYINNKTNMRYICSCGNESEICFSNFKAGNRCDQCGTKKTSNARKKPFEYVKKFFKENGCDLLEDTYSNCHEPLKYKCSCGNESMISFSAFQIGQRCKICGDKKSSDSQKLPFSEVENLFITNGCMLLETEYINSNTAMRYICECGNEASIKYKKFQIGQRCSDCGIKKSSNSQKLPYYEVIKIFEKEGCKLLEENYINNSTKMKYICSCGNEAEASLDKFKVGQRCDKCATARRSGENHHNWLGGISDINNHLRSKIIQWKKDSLQKSRYRCIITGTKSKDLEIHHIYPFNKIVKQTMELTKLPVLKTVNEYTQYELETIERKFEELHSSYGIGVLLTPSLHEEFHNIYGYIDFTPENFEEFKQIKILQLPKNAS